MYECSGIWLILKIIYARLCMMSLRAIITNMAVLRKQAPPTCCSSFLFMRRINSDCVTERQSKCICIYKARVHVRRHYLCV